MNTLGDLARKIAELDPPPTNLDVCRAYADACRDVRREARHEARARRAAIEAARRDGPEEWRPIPGFPGYDISDRLRVRSRWSTSGALRVAPRILRPLWEADRRGARYRLKHASGGFVTVRAAFLCKLALGLTAEVA